MIIIKVLQKPIRFIVNGHLLNTQSVDLYLGTRMPKEQLEASGDRAWMSYAYVASPTYAFIGHYGVYEPDIIIDFRDFVLNSVGFQGTHQNYPAFSFYFTCLTFTRLNKHKTITRHINFFDSLKQIKCTTYIVETDKPSTSTETTTSTENFLWTNNNELLKVFPIKDMKIFSYKKKQNFKVGDKVKILAYQYKGDKESQIKDVISMANGNFVYRLTNDVIFSHKALRLIND